MIRKATIHHEALLGADEEFMVVGERFVEIGDDGVVERRIGCIGKLNFQADARFAFVCERRSRLAARRGGGAVGEPLRAFVILSRSGPR